MKVALLNPIIADKKYKGLSDGDRRVGELAQALVALMDESLFDADVINAVKMAGLSLSFSALEQALEKLYDPTGQRSGSGIRTHREVKAARRRVRPLRR